MSNPYVKHYSQNGRRYKERIDRHTGEMYTTIKPICFVPVVDCNGIPLMPTSSKRCTELLTKGKARVYKMYPIFTIQMIDRRSIDSSYQPITVGIDPGSKYTGIAVARDAEDGNESYVLRKLQVDHRGHKITEDLKGRKAYRSTRRSRKTRYRKPRFLNRKRDKGWVPPSLVSRTDNIINHVKKLLCKYPITNIELEEPSFDTSKLRDNSITGKQYRVSPLGRLTMKEYLLHKYKYTCQYCGTKSIKGNKVRLEIEHIVPRSKGGSDTLKNVTLACERCNKAKDNMTLSDFLAIIYKDDLTAQVAKFTKILTDAKATFIYKEATIVQSMKTRLHKGLMNPCVTVTKYTPTQTSMNCRYNNISKSHANDAACVGPHRHIYQHDIPTLHIQAMGRGRYQRFTGYVKGEDGKKVARYRGRLKEIEGFRTGDIVITNDDVKCRVTITADKQFIVTPIVKGSKPFKRSYRKMGLLYRNDGYLYSQFRE